MSGHNQPGVATGSIEGSGTVVLGRNKLTVGANRLRTTFSGLIKDGSVAGGSLAVSGGRLTLTGASTYTGGTSVSGGTLVANNESGSATGPGPVAIGEGTLAGQGFVGGAVTVGTGSGAGAILSPGSKATRSIGNFTVASSVNFNSDGVYFCEIQRQASDRLTANGVTINSGAQFNLALLRHAAPRPRTQLTVIDNTSALPIAGTFANLAQGAILLVEGVKFQADYLGGDGNDLTLTVVR